MRVELISHQCTTCLKVKELKNVYNKTDNCILMKHNIVNNINTHHVSLSGIMLNVAVSQNQVADIFPTRYLDKIKRASP